MLMLQVRYTLQEGKDPAAFVHALEQADIPARTRAETGCCQYEFFYSASSPNEVLLLEAWADESRSRPTRARPSAPSCRRSRPNMWPTCPSGSIRRKEYDVPGLSCEGEVRASRR